MTVAEAIARGRDALVAAGVPADEVPGDAEVLARHALGWDLARLATSLRDAASHDFQDRYDELIARRSRREPVSQIAGHREFWGLEFEVTPDVLTPRPETELAVQAALDVCRSAAESDVPLPRDPPVIVDVGTGSGCIAIALATELPNAMFIASDASLAALTVARRNAARHGVSRRIAFLHTTVIPPATDCEILVSNPPYIPSRDRAALPPEVREYEPALALFGGEDGLDAYRELFTNARGELRENGRMIVEVGYDQATAVRALADPDHWLFERSHHDLQGIERVLTFRVLGQSADVEDEGRDEQL
ncbi:MAG: peptide chain release factor N(5)-glutamine methyltransferase [Vicinamibacterales bacterium]